MNGEGLDDESVPSGQGFDQSCLCNEASIKPQKDAAGELGG